MSETVFTLGALASDLAFSVSFGIGRELLGASEDSNVSDEELVAAVLVVTVVTTALPATLSHGISELKERKVLPKVVDEVPKGLTQFVSLLVDIARRIAVSLAVQLLSQNTRGRQTDRGSRVVNLVSVAIFFLFLEATAGIARPK